MQALQLFPLGNTVPFWYCTSLTLHMYYIHVVWSNHIYRSSTFPTSNFIHAHFTHLFVISAVVACHFAIDTNAVSRLTWEAERRAKSCPQHVQTNGARTVGQLFNNGSAYLLQWVPSSRSSCQSHFKWPPLQTGSFRKGSSTIMRLRLSHERD